MPSPGAVDPLDVCNLGPDPLADRLRWIRDQILPHALGKQRLEDGIAIELSDVDGMRAQLDEWLELERACCRGIRFERHTSLAPDRVRIEIHGVDPNGRLFRGLPKLPGGGDLGPPRRLGRILRAGSLGAMASVFLLCVVPLALASLLGAAVMAGPLAALDDPLWVGLGALAGAAFVWFRSGRRGRRERARG